MTPFVLETDMGIRLDLTRDPPTVVTTHIDTAVRNWRQARVLRCFPAAIPLGMTWNDVRNEDEVGSRLLPPRIHSAEKAIATALHTKSGAIKQLNCWKPSFRQQVVSAMVGRQWPQARLRRVFGEREIQSDRCQLCGEEAGTSRALSSECPCGWMANGVEASHRRVGRDEWRKERPAQGEGTCGSICQRSEAKAARKLLVE